MKKLFIIAALLFSPILSHAVVTNVQTRPAGSSGSVQFNKGGVFGSSPTFTYNKTTGDLTVSTVSVTYIDGSSATLHQIRWPDGTIQTTAAGSGAYITLTNVLQNGATFYVSSGTVNTLNIGTAIRFPDGSLQITAAAGGGGGSYWVKNATDTLEMGGLYSINNATNVVTQALNVTRSTLTVNSVPYVFPSTITTGSKLLVFTKTGNDAVGALSDVITDGVRPGATTFFTAAIGFGSTVTLPTLAMTGALDSTGELALQTNAYTLKGSSGTLVFYADGVKYYVVTTTGVPFHGAIAKFSATSNRYDIMVDSGSTGGGGSGTPGGSDTQFQYNDGTALGGVSVVTFNDSTNQVTFASATSHTNVSSVTHANANLVMSGTSKIYFNDGTVQTSSPSFIGPGPMWITDLDSTAQLRFDIEDLPLNGGFGPQTPGGTYHYSTFENDSAVGAFSFFTSTQPAFNGQKPYSGWSIIPPSSLSSGSMDFVVNRTSILQLDDRGAYFPGRANSSAEIRVGEASANGNDYIALGSSPSLSGSTTWVLPTSTGPVGSSILVGSINGNTTYLVLGAGGGGGGSGDIEGVTANAPLTGGGTTGTVSLGVDASSVTLQGNTFNVANRLLLLDGSGDVPNANLAAGATLDSEWDTIAELESVTGANILTSGEVSGGGYNLEPATVTINMGGNSVTNVSTLTFKSGANAFTVLPSTWVMLTGNDFSTSTNTATATAYVPALNFNLPANTTWYVSWVAQIDTNAGNGVKFAVDIPTNGTVRLTGEGPSTSATATRRNEFIGFGLTLNTNAFGTFSNNNHKITWDGMLYSGDGGTVHFLVASGIAGQDVIPREGTMVRLDRWE